MYPKCSFQRSPYTALPSPRQSILDPSNKKITKNHSPINYSSNQFIKDSPKPHYLHPTFAPTAITTHTS